MNSMSSVLNFTNTVYIHTILSPQAPTSETIIGRMEYPIPRIAPTITSISPHKKYIVDMMDSLISP